jgi:hypothetical protein
MAENLWTALGTVLAAVSVSVGSFGFVVKGQNGKLKEQEKKVILFDEKKLDKEKYYDLQTINNLEIKKHFSEELNDFKNEIFPLIRNLQPQKEVGK